MRRRTFLQGTAGLAGASLLGWPRKASAQAAAQTAVEAAKQFSGSEISIVWEAGLQALDPLNFSGPRWQEATGIKVNVIEVPTAEMFTKILQEHRAGSGAYDALNVIPSWMPDLARRRARAAGRVRRQVRLSRRAADHRARLPRQPDDGRRQDLCPPGRW